MHDVATDTAIKNAFATVSFKQKRKDAAVRWTMRIATYFILACAFFVFIDIISKGAPVILDRGLDFFTKNPETLMVFETADGTEHQLGYSDFVVWKDNNPDQEIVEQHGYTYCGGGILGPVVGTAFLTIICIVVALFIGLTSAIYLNEYSGKGKFMDMIRLAILNLAGVPSIVFGLFGLGLFCLAAPVITNEIKEGAWHIPLLSGYAISFQGWGTSMIAGGFTLAVMILPVIITACEESLKAIPMGFREASLALGATKWQTIRKAVLPYAFPGMLTASILGITRVAGETAPIMFTAAMASKATLPWQGLEGNVFERFFGFLSQSVQALPYHIYTVAARIPQSEYTKPMQYGSVFVFMVIVMAFAAMSIFMRIHYRKKLKW